MTANMYPICDWRPAAEQCHEFVLCNNYWHGDMHWDLAWGMGTGVWLWEGGGGGGGGGWQMLACD